MAEAKRVLSRSTGRVTPQAGTGMTSMAASENPRDPAPRIATAAMLLMPLPQYPIRLRQFVLADAQAAERSD